jgi:hypothetical protein
MPKYKCKVDVVYTYDLEIPAINKEEAEHIAEYIDLNSTELTSTFREVTDCGEISEPVIPFTYPALPDDAPQDLKDAYAVFEKYIKASVELPGTNKEEFEYSDDPTSLTGDFLNHESKEKIRKQSDTTKITQQQYDDILDWYQAYREGKLAGIRTTEVFVNFLNIHLGLNKSRSVYSKIWCGGVVRESLPKGE